MTGPSFYSKFYNPPKHREDDYVIRERDNKPLYPTDERIENYSIHHRDNKTVITFIDPSIFMITRTGRTVFKK